MPVLGAVHQEVELTVQAVVTRGAEGGLSWKIFKAGVSRQHADTHTVKLTLRRVGQTPEGQIVRDSTIAAESYVDGEISFG